MGRTAWEELPDKDVVRAILAASEGDHQPLCAQCAYRPACTLTPSRHQAARGAAGMGGQLDIAVTWVLKIVSI